jgi:beta-phosphoglucomutase family hydrolase
MCKKKLQAVIWDMDGVLVDSEHVHFDSWRVVFKKHGLTFDDSSLTEIFGMNSGQVIRRIGAGHLPDEDIVRLIEEKDRIFQDWIKKKAQFLPGAREWLETFSSDGLPQALASSSSPDSIDVILGALGARQYFKIILSGRDLPSKPDPHLFLLAAQRLRVQPEECLVIEDAVVGVSAAKSAGMTCLAVATTNHTEALHAADLVRASLEDVRYDDILNLF